MRRAYRSETRRPNRACDGEDRAALPDLTVFEMEVEWEETGLLDADGEPILRRLRWPLGFLAPDDDA